MRHSSTPSTRSRACRRGRAPRSRGCAPEFPGLAYIWSVVRAESLEKPDMAAAFQIMTEGSIRGARHIMEDPDDAAAVLHEWLSDLRLPLLKSVRARPQSA